METTPTQEELQKFYIGKDINDVPKPAAVLDVAIIRRHCETMLRTIKALNVGFRVHVKSHKVRKTTRPTGNSTKLTTPDPRNRQAPNRRQHRGQFHSLHSARDRDDDPSSPRSETERPQH